MATGSDGSLRITASHRSSLPPGMLIRPAQSAGSSRISRTGWVEGGCGGQRRCRCPALGLFVTFAAVLSMIGLFIGNSLGGTRVPFALAEDGMMPKWLVHVQPKYGTPWVAILFCAVIFSIFSIAGVCCPGRDRRLPANAGHPDGVRSAVEVPPHAAGCAADEGARRLPSA